MNGPHIGDEAPCYWVGNDGDRIAPTTADGRVSLTTTGGIGGTGRYRAFLPAADTVANSIQLRYHDTSIAHNAGETKVCNVPAGTSDGPLVSDDSLADDDWATESGIAVAARAAGAVDSVMIDIASISAKRVCIEIVVTANGVMSAWPWGK